MPDIADRLKNVTVSASVAMTQKARDLAAQGIDVVGLSTGEPDFPTPPHVIDAAYAACWRRYLFLCAKVRQNPTPQLVKAISKEQFLMQGLISYLPNCRQMKMTEKLSAARWAMMSAESLCPIKK